MLRLSTIHSWAELPELEPHWNRLLQSSASDCIFLTWEYLSLFVEIYGEQGFRPLVQTAWEGQHLVGLAPLMVHSGGGRLGRHVRCLMFIGQGTDQTPEYLDFIVERGKEPEVTRALCQRLLQEDRHAWDHLLLERVRDDSPNLAEIQRCLGDGGVALERIDETECPFTDLSQGYEQYLASKRGHFRRKLGYNLRRLGKEGEVRFRWVDRDVPLEQAYQRLVQLNRDRWGEEGESFRTEAYREFHRRFAERCLERGWLWMAELWVDDTVVADRYDFLYRDKIWGNQGGWLRRWEKLNVGKLVIAQLMELGAQAGALEYDFLGGAAEYKLAWSTGTRRMASYIGSNVTLRGRLYGAAQVAKVAVKQYLSQERLAQLKRVARRVGL